MAKTMYDVMKELGIKICPKCKNEYTGHPALSRVDNKTEICSKCGSLEALEAFKNYQEKEKVEHTCIFEKRYCKYAHKKGSTFKCTAPSDDDMTCN